MAKAWRQFPRRRVPPAPQASAPPYLTYWVHQVNQPLRNRVLKRQQPRPTTPPVPAAPSQAPYIPNWVHPVNQPLRSRIPKRQQPAPVRPPSQLPSQAPYLSYWIKPVNQPRRVVRRQQPWYSGQEPFYGIPVASATPSVSSWKQPTSQPPRNRIPKRLQVSKAQPPYPAQESQAPYVSYWVRPVNQPFRNRIPRRQQVGRTVNPFYGIIVIATPLVSSWIHPVNQPLRTKAYKRQMPNSYKRVYFASGSAGGTSASIIFLLDGRLAVKVSNKVYLPL